MYGFPMNKIPTKQGKDKMLAALHKKMGELRSDLTEMNDGEFKKFFLHHLITTMKRKDFRIEDTDQSYRVINHWCEIGLIDDSREKNAKGWRHFSGIDLLWIKVIEELRAYGLSLETIGKVKKFLFPIENGKKIEFYFLSLAKPGHLLVVEKNGDIHLWKKKDGKKLWSERSYVAINLFRIQEEFMQSHFSKFHINEAQESGLNAEEYEFLEILRSGKYSSISVKMQDGKIERFEMEEDVNERIIDLLRQSDFQDITIKKQNGKIVSMKRTLKQKPSTRATEELRASISTNSLSNRKSRS